MVSLHYELANVGVEFGTFRLKPGISEEEMLIAAKRADEEFLSKEKGYIAHFVLRDDENLYADVAIAETVEHAKSICSKWLDNEFTLKYLEKIEGSPNDIAFWTRIK